MTIQITRFVKFETPGSLQGFCDINVGGLVVIRGVRIIAGKRGLFVSMPRQQGKDGRWFDTVVPLTKELRGTISAAVLEAFHATGVDSPAAKDDQCPVVS